MGVVVSGKTLLHAPVGTLVPNNFHAYYVWKRTRCDRINQSRVLTSADATTSEVQTLFHL